MLPAQVGCEMASHCFPPASALSVSSIRRVIFRLSRGRCLVHYCLNQQHHPHPRLSSTTMDMGLPFSAHGSPRYSCHEGAQSQFARERHSSMSECKVSINRIHSQMSDQNNAYPDHGHSDAVSCMGEACCTIHLDRLRMPSILP